MAYFDFMGLDAIGKERVRQIQEEGWTAYHDDQHVDEDLVRAAVVYAMQAISGCIDSDDDDPALAFWPWPENPPRRSTDPIRNLVKAGALIAAEIDRLERAKRGLSGNMQRHEDKAVVAEMEEQIDGN